MNPRYLIDRDYEEGGFVRTVDSIPAVPVGEARPPMWADPGEMFFRLHESSLGTLDLSCETGFVVQEYDFAMPQVREVTFPNMLDDGNFDLTRYLGPRVVSFDIVLRPFDSPSGGAVRSEGAMRDRLLAFLHPRRRPVLLFSELNDPRVRQVRLRGSGGSWPTMQRLANRMQVSWVAPDPLLLNYQQKSARTTIGVTSNLTMQVENEGNAWTHWQLEATGELFRPSITLNNDPATTVKIDYAAPVGSRVVFDSYTKSIFVNGVNTGYRFVTDQSRWFSIPPGTHTITLEHETGDRYGYPNAKWEADTDGTTKWAVPDLFGATVPANNPPPGGAPPWAWSAGIDPNTGLPGVTDLVFTYRDAWL